VVKERKKKENKWYSPRDQRQLYGSEKGLKPKPWGQRKDSTLQETRYHVRGKYFPVTYCNEWKSPFNPKRGARHSYLLDLSGGKKKRKVPGRPSKKKGGHLRPRLTEDPQVPGVERGLCKKKEKEKTKKYPTMARDREKGEKRKKLVKPGGKKRGGNMEVKTKPLRSQRA